MLLTESVVKIRHAVLLNKESIRSVSRRTGLSRNIIRKYLLDPSPPSYQRSACPALHKLSRFESRLRDLYEHEQSRPQLERRTAVIN